MTTTLNPKPHYYPFIDGLRALSILAVVAFHIGLPGFAGGFIGVDVFFVISGFLIITLIREEITRGRFSVWSFYARRTLRILPPYLVMLVVVAVAAFFLLPSPRVIQNYGLSSVFAPLMLANAYFFRKQGYFDVDADDKPLLHTWTLSVEEQFYFAAPFVLLGMAWLLKKHFGARSFTIGAVLALVSFIGCVAMTEMNGRNPAFYLPHLRAWEFILGGLMTYGLAIRLPRLFAQIAGTFGLALILFAITQFDSASAYPSWRAGVPVLGACLLILSGLVPQQEVVTRILSQKPFVAIGLVSYAWYLWHWPLLVFPRVLRLGAPDLATDIMLGGVGALLLACLSYAVIEKPIRLWRKRRDTFAAWKIVVAGIVACLAIAAFSGGLAKWSHATMQSYAERQHGIEGQGGFATNCKIVSGHTLPAHCLAKPYGLILGDSHADAYSGTLMREFAAKTIPTVFIGRGGCAPLKFALHDKVEPRCANLLSAWAQVKAAPPAFVILAANWGIYDFSADQLVAVLKQFDSARTRRLVIAPVPVFPHSALDCVILSDRQNISRERCGKARTELETERSKSMDALRAAAAMTQTPLIDPLPLFCDSSLCKPYENNKVFFSDRDHLTKLGAELVFRHFEQNFHALILK